jgi:ABC-type sulfate transport system permease component
MEPASTFDPASWPRLVVEAYHNAGWAAWANTFIALVLALVITFVWARARDARKLPLLALPIAVPLVLGGLGYLHGMQQVGDALMSVDADMKDRLFEVGRAEAMYNLYIGCALSALLAAVYGVHIAVSGGPRD